MTFRFESGHTIDFTGKIFEKSKRNKKYNDQIDDGFSLEKIEKKGLYLDFTDDNTTMVVKSPDQKLYGNDHWEFWSNFPLLTMSNQSGKAKGDIYLEGQYSQKGRAYTVEDGNFEFYWRNAAEYGMNDTILKGKWTLKRK